jgi:uncharacterized membrane protein YdjX (TVP38/TMEM64 family)
MVDMQSILEWVESLGTVGAIAFIVVYILATIAFVPGLLLTLGAGLLFGAVWGSVYVFVASTAGAILAFWIGRYFLRDWISKKIAGNVKFQAIDTAVGKSGFKIVLLTRLSPAFPFNLLNYAYGVTGVSLRDYSLASIGMIPATILYVYIGSLAGSIATLGSNTKVGDPKIQLAAQVLGLVATIVVTVYITRLAQKALAETIAESGKN